MRKVNIVNLDKLKQNLEPALKHIDLLCSGYRVEVVPSYRSVLDKVCERIRAKKTWQQKIEEILFLIKEPRSTAMAFQYDLIKQFKEKFLEIAKNEIVPQLQKFCSNHPDIDIDDFRPLFDIRISRDKN